MARLVRGEITADRGGSPPLPGTEEEPSVRAPGDSCRTDTGDPGLCLDSAQHDFKKYVTQDSQTSLRDGYWKNSDNLCCSLHSIPKAGFAVATWTAVHFFDVYLENAQKPFGDNQVVLHRFQGTFNPVGQGNWWQMHRDFGYWLNALNYYLERAWWTGLFEVSVNPVGATQRYLRPDPRGRSEPESQPPTPTSETQYTTGNRVADRHHRGEAGCRGRHQRELHHVEFEDDHDPRLDLAEPVRRQPLPVAVPCHLALRPTPRNEPERLLPAC